MPTYKQAGFIRRALEGLFAQSLQDWELCIIDDGSPDETMEAVKVYLDDPRVSCLRFDRNRGLGAALNEGIRLANGEFISYLPSDDVIYADHLASLARCLEERPGAVLAYSGVRHHYNRSAEGQIDGYPLQLVQVIHRRTPEVWLERSELVTDDLERMYWSKLRQYGVFHGTGSITCEWVDHPHQHHKILHEPVGGINPYRLYYQVQHPIRMHTTKGNLIDEEEHYRRFRERPDTPPALDGLKILLVGELAYNPERVLAFEERGHRLYGLWMQEPYWYNTVGPLPFGHVQDLPHSSWKESVRKAKPDIIYALLNWQAVPFAHQVMMENPGVPFVWHFKEGPFISLEKGHWAQLIDLFRFSDGQIYSSPEMRDWFETIIPGLASGSRAYVLDGDLPKRDWFTAERSPRLSEKDGEIHTVVPGRPIGLHPHTVVELSEQGIHLHFYGDFTHGQWLEWIEKTKRLAPRHIHLHHQVDQERWVEEFSQYDAGWLHYFESKNRGELRRADWDDLNYPARIATLVCAGLPLLQRANPGSIVATQNLARDLDMGVFFKDMVELARHLRDKSRIEMIRSNVWRSREQFTFDYHVSGLVQFFRMVIESRNGRIGESGKRFPVMGGKIKNQLVEELGGNIENSSAAGIGGNFENQSATGN
jgi:glycosyltransferase involved in cell wall biosynthesis